MPDSPQAQAAQAARSLRKGAHFDLLVLAGFGVAPALMFGAEVEAVTFVGGAISLVLGLGAIFYSLRVRFDAAIFDRWGASADIEAEMLAFDARLQGRFAWRRSAPRPLPERIAGALRLLAQRNYWRLLQGTMLLVTLLSHLLSPLGRA